MMVVIVTRQNPDGSYDKVGMVNRRLYKQYKSIRSARRYAARDWSDPCRFEYCDGVYDKPFFVEIRQKGKFSQQSV